MTNGGYYNLGTNYKYILIALHYFMWALNFKKRLP